MGLTIDRGRLTVSLLGALMAALLATACAPLRSLPAEKEAPFLWEHATKDYVRGHAASAQGIIFFGSDDNALHAIAADSGVALWSVVTHDNVTGRPAVTLNSVCFGSWDGTIRCVDQVTGEALWVHQAKGPVSGALAAQDETVYAGSHDGWVYALTRDTGQLRWRVCTGGAASRWRRAGWQCSLRIFP